MNGMTTVNTFIHYLSLSCARAMHFPSAFHLSALIAKVVHISECQFLCNVQQELLTHNY